MSKICPRCSELLPDDAGFCPFDGAELQKNNDRFLGKTIAARYRLIRKLGSGGMSLVYLARHELISRLSAIKILRPELSRLPEHRERFLREARAVNRINHENIVEITDVGESDGVAYLVMEYVEGQSLFVQLQDGPFRWERASRIAMQVASALARTHQTGIIHRDLKPENILLLPQKARSVDAPAADEVVKLTDFGIAKMTGEPTLTFNEQLFGTPGYIAPEYVSGLPIDGRADIYSLAVVLYEMVTGQLPFEGRGQSDLLLKPLTTSPIPIGQRVRGLPADFEALVTASLAREPDGRPHDAFAFHDRLADILLRHGSSARAPADATTPTEAAVVQRTSKLELELAEPSETADVGKSVTRAMSSRWSVALGELETQIARARAYGGPSATAAARAADLAIVAAEMIPRVERAAAFVAGLQAEVDGLEAAGRDFRASFGHAIDVLVHDRSRARGEGVVLDLDFQIDALQKQLDERNEAHEQALVRATGALEGSLSAVRRLTNELARTIDDGIDMLQPPG